MKITFHFYEGREFASNIIKARLSSKFSHMAIEFENGYVYESLLLKGAIKTPRSKVGKGDVVLELEVGITEYVEALKNAETMVGKPYDYKSIIGFAIGRPIQSVGGKFCSEMGCELFTLSTGIEVVHYTLVSPETLLMVVSTYINTQQKFV